MGRLNQIARTWMREHSGDLCGRESCDRYFIHSLGHGIGMDVHDPGPANVLVPGMVFTVEPGLYTPELGGFRHSDTVAVTKDGIEMMTYYARDLPSLTIPV